MMGLTESFEPLLGGKEKDRVELSDGVGSSIEPFLELMESISTTPKYCVCKS
jgi:hypothetical protein